MAMKLGGDGVSLVDLRTRLAVGGPLWAAAAGVRAGAPAPEERAASCSFRRGSSDSWSFFSFRWHGPSG